jgi:hypothetical protein
MDRYLDKDDVVSSELISSEIESVVNALQVAERKKLKLRNVNETGEHQSPSSRLRQLERNANELLLAREVSIWMEDIIRDDERSGEDLFSDCKRCESLSSLLCRNTRQLSPLFQHLFEDEYVPLFHYVCDELIFFLRESLEHARYPERTADLLQGLGSASDISRACASRVQVESSHVELLLSLQKPFDGAGQASLDAVVLELCRPFVERVRYHFLDNARLASGRIDRLPDLLLGYLREHIFAPDGVWDFVVDGISRIREKNDQLVAASDGIIDEKLEGGSSRRFGSPSVDLTGLPVCFLNELIRIIQWVLGERNFFRHQHVAGPESNPLVICNAVQHLFQFDDFLLGLVRVIDPSSTHRRRLLRLTDIFLAGDDDLMQWWLNQERELAYNRLFENMPDDEPVNNVAPRAELFCALMVSIQAKASVFSFSGPYLSHVAAPLCVQFLDAVHESATELKEAIQRRRMLSDSELSLACEKWIELINGTDMAAGLLCTQDAEQSDEWQAQIASNDLDRFGRSLHNLRQVMIDDFCVAFVEVLLMERAKFASYLMRCPHLLGHDRVTSTSDSPEGSQEASLSPDLRESARVLALFLLVCEGSSSTTALKADHSREVQGNASIAAARMREGVLTLVAEKLLEVAMNFQGSTPDLLTGGCVMFARDVHSLFDSALLPLEALRLLDISRVMAMESAALVHIGGVLCGLAGLPAPLPEDAFMGDERLHEEATSMVRAKGLAFVEVEDVISVLNRRRDLRASPTRPSDPSM